MNMEKMGTGVNKIRNLIKQEGFLEVELNLQHFLQE